MATNRSTSRVTFMAASDEPLSGEPLVSLGPDCGVRMRIDEQAMPWNKRGPTNFFDWMLSSLAAVAAVLDCVDPGSYFGADHWSLVGISPSGSYEFEHEPTGLRSLHDAKTFEYESANTARLAVAERYVRRLHRLRQLFEAPGSLRLLHVADNENEMNVRPPPSRDAIRRVRKLLAARHKMVIAHDSNFASAASLSVAGVALVDTRQFRRHAQDQLDDLGNTQRGTPRTGNVDFEEPAGWRRAHLDWESLLQAVSVAEGPMEAVALEVAVRAEGALGCDVTLHFTSVAAAMAAAAVAPTAVRATAAAATVAAAAVAAVATKASSTAAAVAAATAAAAAVAARAAAASEASPPAVLMRCEFEVLSDGDEVSIEGHYHAAAAISLPGVSWCGWRPEPLFFGLEKLVVIVRLSGDRDLDGGSADDVLGCLQGLEGVQSAKLLSATQGADVFETCARLFSVPLDRRSASALGRDLGLPCLTAQAAATLMRCGWATIDDWLPAEVVEGIASVAAASMRTRRNGGSDGVDWRTPEPRHARTDVATWLTVGQRPASDSKFSERLLPRFDALAADLCLLMDGIHGRLELQLACFPEARHARYRRHTDANAVGGPASDERKVTCILYCNPTWSKASAGCLRLTRPDHDKGGAGGTIDIEPIGGRLLVFMSGAIAHEVLPTEADRFAVTAWLT